jgi:hypothetical protein
LDNCNYEWDNHLSPNLEKLMAKKKSHPMKLIVNFAILSLLSTTAYAQQVLIRKTDQPIHIDGQMNEACWQSADVAENFIQYFPSDTIAAKAQTEVRMLYDENYIYILAKMHNLGPRSYVTPSLRRDFRGEANDVFTVFFDTFKDRNNAFLFGLNPFGVQREGLISNGGSTGRPDMFSLAWDNKWYSAAKTYPDYWIAEMAIPFNSLRYPEDEKEWLINFYRFDSEYAEQSCWAPIPLNQMLINLSFSGRLIWEEPLQRQGGNISLIPFATASSQSGTNEHSSGFNADAGMDAKLGIGTGLNLDITLNPDFSQVEVDQQVTNLDRFEILFPERRQFFLENADLFANFGLEEVRPFFTRRVGLADTSVNRINRVREVPILAGARLTGKLGNKFRLGLLSIQEAPLEEPDRPSVNHTVATLQQQIFTNSNIGVLFANQQVFGQGQDWNKNLVDRYNRTFALDLNLRSADNIWNTKAFYQQTINPERQAHAAGGFLTYNTEELMVDITLLSIEDGFNPASGFLRRDNIRQIRPQLWYNFYPNKGKVQRHGPGTNATLISDQGNRLLDWEYALGYRFSFKSTALLEFTINRAYTYLFQPFDPSGRRINFLPAETDYVYNRAAFTFLSDARRNFSYTLAGSVGEFFNGNRINLSGNLNYRYQPLGFTSLVFNYDRISLPEPGIYADLILIGPRFDFTFSKNLFWTTFLQYNSQISNFNINSRLQWRFLPVSDVFLVYTDNYNADGWLNLGGSKSRALVLKVSYWLNI